MFYTHTDTQMHTHAHTRTRKHMHTRTRVHTHIHIHKHAHTYTHMHAHTHMVESTKMTCMNSLHSIASWLVASPIKSAQIHRRVSKVFKVHSIKQI